MSNRTRYLVFEESSKPLNMNKINVFANGAEMPWTYYQADITDTNDGRPERFMWTSESKPSSPGADDAGTYASQVKRIVYNNGIKQEQTLNGNEISIQSLKSWGWPLEKDANGVEVLPKYGEFVFAPNETPSYEDLSSIKVDFKFGFGLNGTCYNFVDETVNVDVYNLTCAPEFYITSNPTCNPTFENGQWNPDMTPAVDGKIKTNLIEGTSNGETKDAKYLLIKVEAGENVEITSNKLAANNGEIDFFPTQKSAKLYKDETNTPAILRVGNEWTVTTGFTDANVESGNTDNYPGYLIEPYKMNVPFYDAVSGMNMKFDFYRMKLEVNDAYSDLAYLSVPDLVANLMISPVVYQQTLTSFRTPLQIDVCVDKRVKLPYIRDDLELSSEQKQNSVDCPEGGEARDLSDASNLRMRLIVTPEEAINYGIKTGTGPSFLRNKTPEEALYFYNRSLLTETEKALDDYKLSFASEDKLKELVYYIAVDMSEHVRGLFKTFSVDMDTEANDFPDMSAVCDLSNVYFGRFGTGNQHNYDTEIKALREAITSQLQTDASGLQRVSLASILGNSVTASRFQEVLEKFKSKPVIEKCPEDIRGNFQRDLSNLPHEDSFINMERRFGEIVDVSCSKYLTTDGGETYSHDRIRTSLMGSNSTMLTLAFALYKHKTTGSDALVDRYYSAMQSAKANNGTLYELVEAMQKEYYPKKDTDASGNSMLRDYSLYEELEDFRCELNPVDGSTAIKFITNIVKIVDTKYGVNKDAHVAYFGTDSVFDIIKNDHDEPGKDTIKKLLYKGGASKNIIETLIGNTATSGNFPTSEYSFKVANPALAVSHEINPVDDYNYRISQTEGGKSYKTHYAYESLMRNTGYGAADQSAVFYTHQSGETHDYAKLYTTNKEEYLLGDASGTVTSFYMNDDKDNGDIGEGCVEKQWVYTKQHMGEVATLAGSGDYILPYTLADKRAGGYADVTRHEENKDFSGIIKIGGGYNGDYIDAYVFDGTKDVMVKETYIDMYQKTKLTNAYKADNEKTTVAAHYTDIDVSSLEKYEYMTKDISDSRPEILKKIDTKLKIVSVNGFHFYRIGRILRVVADKEVINCEVDGDKAIAGIMPKITFKTRGDTKGVCDKAYQLYVWPEDVSSNLRIAVNPFRCYGMSYDVSNVHFENGLKGINGGDHRDESGVSVSRWSKAYIPVDISGILEHGEAFNLSLSNDNWEGSLTVFDMPSKEKDVKSGTNPNATMLQPKSDFTDASAVIPDDCLDCAYILEYKYEGGVWANANGVTFEYECHNKDTAPDYNDASNTKYNSMGAPNVDSDNNPLSETNRATSKLLPNGDFRYSSNIKGYPSFRLCLPSQSKLLHTYRNAAQNQPRSTTNNMSNFGTILRAVDINLTYTHKKDIDSKHHQKTTAYAYVHSDDYDANISVTELRWEVPCPGEPQEYKKQTSYRYGLEGNENTLPGTGSENKISVVTHGVKDKTSSRGYQPDESIMQKWDFDQNAMWHKYLTATQAASNPKQYVGEGDRDASSILIKCVENTFGPDMPIAEICFDNYIKSDGTYGASIENIPLFSRGEDFAEYMTHGTYNSEQNKDSLNNKDYLPFNSSYNKNFLPKNTNYDIYLNAEGNKGYLYRKTPVNYETWRKTYGAPSSNFELVSVGVKYALPNSVEGTLSVTSEVTKTIVFIVEHTDAPEIKWSDNFTINVDEGAASADVTSILSATLHGDSECIKYYIAGAIDESGCIHYADADSSANFLGQNAIFDMSKQFDASNIKLIDTDEYTSDLLIDSTTTWTKSNDLLNKTDTELTDKLVNGRLIFYHKNHKDAVTATSNPRFDSYTRRSHKLLVVAVAEEQQDIERKLALVNINVRPASTGFFIGSDKTSVITVTETLGTIAEGYNESTNNPEFSINDKIFKAIQHEDLTESEISNKDKVKFSITYLDPDLTICPPTGVAGENLQLKDKVIKLKDIDANKTTETADKPSEKLAYYNHYNYERKSEYQIHVCAELISYKEIYVKPVENYICGEDSTSGIGQEANKNAQTADFVMLAQTEDGIQQDKPAGDHSKTTKQFYFKHPVTGKYVGPLSTQPSSLEDLGATKLVNGVKAKYAYVRYEDKNATLARDQQNAGTGHTYTPLYKAPGFSDRMAKAPKAQDTCLNIFKIKVLDTFDKPKTLPQPFEPKANTNFKFSDPTDGVMKDTQLITIEEGAKHITYVFADHAELDKNNKQDHEDGATIPTWHPYYVQPTDAAYDSFTAGQDKYKGNLWAESTHGTARKSHPRAEIGDTQSAYKKKDNLDKLDGRADGSLRYGKFHKSDGSSSDNSGAVFLDFFVEHHGSIDCSGWSEYADEYIIGEQVDYSGTVGTYIYKNKFNSDQHNGAAFGGHGTIQVENSDMNMYRLNCMVRNAQHYNTDLSQSFYAKGEVAFNGCNRAEFGKVYKFSVAGVTNKLATQYDLSFNKNMVDWDRTFYPYRSQVATERTNNGNNSVDMPQPFQKYVYDPSGERIVTYGYAINNLHENLSMSETTIHNGFPFARGDKSVDSSGTTGAIIRPGRDGEEDHYYGDSYKKVHADSSGTLYATRSHFTVVVTKSGCDIVTSDRLSETTGKMVFNSQEMLKGVKVATGQTEVTNVPSNLGAKDGEVRIMEKTDGSRIMAYYNSTSNKWNTI